MSARPAEILGLGKEFGGLEKGCEANLTLVDLSKEWVVKADQFESKSKNSCFLEMKMKGKVQATLCAGKFWRYQ